MKDVIIYSTSVCQYCDKAKEFFKEKGISYTEYNVGTDPERRAEMIDLTGQLGVPVIRIGDDVTVGFERNYIANKLGIAA